MDRVAQLAAEADMCLWEEKWDCPKDWADARKITREYLAVVARDLGFPESEISSAIDTALKGR